MDNPETDTPPGEPVAKEGAPPGGALEPAIAYSRRLYDDVLGWYRSADAKAQVVIRLDGAFLAFIMLLFAGAATSYGLAARLAG